LPISLSSFRLSFFILPRFIDFVHLFSMRQLQGIIMTTHNNSDADDIGEYALRYDSRYCNNRLCANML
jgi:hypothetical protein